MDVRFLPGVKNMRNSFFFLIEPRLDPALDFFESHPLKSENTHKIGITTARYAMLVLIFVVFQRKRQW